MTLKPATRLRFWKNYFFFFFFFTHYFSNTEVERLLALNSGEEHYPAAPAGDRSRDISITDKSGILLTEFYYWVNQKLNHRKKQLDLTLEN